MSDAERLARAVLLFFSDPPWTPEKRAEWTELVGDYEATSVSLCNLAREMTPTPRADQP